MSFNIARNGKKRVVIIGGGFAGLRLVHGLRKSNFQVVLIDQNNYNQFQPLIYQVATAGLNPSSIAFPFRKLIEDQDDFYFRMTELRAVYASENYIQTSIGKIDYDYLVLACGVTTNFYGNEQIRQVASPMKTVSEAMALRNALLINFERSVTCASEQERQELLNVVIVGGGPSGVEIAGAMAEMKRYILPKDYPDMKTSMIHIFLIEGSGRLLSGMSEKASAKALKFLKKMKVNVKLNTLVTTYSENEVRMSDGTSIPCRNLIWVGGVTGHEIHGMPASCVGRGGRILVDEFNKVRGSFNIYAIGDIALMDGGDPEYPKGHPQMAQPAIQQGATLALNLRALESDLPMIPFRYNNRGSMATIGKNKAVADIGNFRFAGFTAWLLWMAVHLFSILGVRNKFFVFMDWVWNYFTYDRSNRMILTSAGSRAMKDLETRARDMHWGDLRPDGETEDGNSSPDTARSDLRVDGTGSSAAAAPVAGSAPAPAAGGVAAGTAAAAAGAGTVAAAVTAASEGADKEDAGSGAEAVAEAELAGTAAAKAEATAAPGADPAAAGSRAEADGKCCGDSVPAPEQTAATAAESDPGTTGSQDQEAALESAPGGSGEGEVAPAADKDSGQTAGTVVQEEPESPGPQTDPAPEPEPASDLHPDPDPAGAAGSSEDASPAGGASKPSSISFEALFGEEMEVTPEPAAPAPERDPEPADGIGGSSAQVTDGREQN